MSRSDFETRWMKFGQIKEIIFVGTDVIGIASGIHVKFINLTTLEERIEVFDSVDRGRGASCLAGHPVVPMFATAERRLRPKIFIFTYPKIRKVSNCVLEKGANGYLSNSFAGTDYLVTLTTYPNYEIIVWLWRTGECMTTIDTMITDRIQRIICSPCSPHLVSQVGETSGNLAVYEISVCSRIVSIVSVNEASMLSKTSCVSWTPDGNLFHCDDMAKVSLISSDGKKSSLVAQSEDDKSISNGRPLVETFQTGVIIVNRTSEILFYRKPPSDHRLKSGSPWPSVWSIQATSHPVCVTRCPNRDSLLFCGDRGEIFEVNVNGEDDSVGVRTISYQGSKYNFLTLINPYCDHVVAVDEFDRLNTIQCMTGQFMGNICLKIYGQIQSVGSHPTLPIIGCSTDIGKCILISMVLVSDPSVIRIIYLHKEPLDKVRYSWSASLLGVANSDREKLFVVDNSNDEKNAVLGLLQSPKPIIDFLIYEITCELSKIVLLVKTNKYSNFGCNIMIFSFNNFINIQELDCIIEMPVMLNLLNYGRNKYEIIVIPYLTKQLHLIKIQDDFKGLILTDAFSSGHQLRNINMNISENFVVTFSYDGLIIIRNKVNIQQVASIFMSHHKLDGGAKLTFFSAATNMIVSLGRNGDLIGTKICYLEPAVDVSGADEFVLSVNAINEPPTDDNVTWIERRDAMNFQMDLEKCAAERSLIIQAFIKMRERLKILLDANYEEPENSQLSISDFDLDRIGRIQKIYDNTAHRTQLKNKLEDQISQQDRVSKFLRGLCWDSMQIPACSLLSVNGTIKIENFPMPDMSIEQKNRRNWDRFIVELKPCLNITEKTVDGIFQHLTIVGTTTDRWIPKLSDSMGNQVKKFAGHTDGVRTSTIVRDHERNLKIIFNQLFEDMRTVKNYELDRAARCIKDIDHCMSELKNMFNIVYSDHTTLPQPLWHYTEKPETIVDVTDGEISAGRAAIYLERDIRAELMMAQQEERLRLNDRFREGALQKMMDGLLEVRWEDEIKMDPVKPLCLLKKDPSSYTEEEAAAVETYNIKCREIEIERGKYRKLLENKIVAVQEALKQHVNTFDHKLNDFYLERMKIESAVFQETLMRLRESQRHSLRLRGMEIMRLTRNEFSLATREFRNLIEVSTTLETVLSDLKNRYDNLSKRDKLSEGKLRGEFPELKQPMIDYLLRQYRKRPRNVQLTCTSITYLAEVCKCIMTGERSEILPRDCLDYLRGMDILDVMPNSLPLQIDASHWYLLCKLRRAKVELEIKIKSCAVDLAEAEQTYVSHQKACSNAENRVLQLKEMIKEYEKQHYEGLEDMQVQIVLKMGQIELRLYGDPNELSNSVLVPFRVVERANNAIIAAGRMKLTAMRKTVEFRRTIMWQEWRHKCMRITLKDMREEVKVLQGVKLTKEIQNYLLVHPRDAEGEKDSKTCERILMSAKERFRNMLEEEKRQFVDAKRKIIVWRKQNRELVDAIENMKLATFKASMVVHDATRERDGRYRKTKLKAIMMRTRLTKKVLDNYNELLSLQTQLELLRLKTYPTLRLKRLARNTAPRWRH